MKKSEFESNGLHMPGDKWGDAALNRKNPGYFDPAYMPIFAAVDTENAEFWSKTAYDANMKLYEASSGEVNTGLVDDWYRYKLKRRSSYEKDLGNSTFFGTRSFIGFGNVFGKRR